MQNPDTGAVGDMREEFALVTLLPVFLRCRYCLGSAAAPVDSY